MTRISLLAVVATAIGCDQVTKRVASTHLMGLPRQSYFGDAARLEYAENRGAFLSLGDGLPFWARTALFSVGTAIILVACVVLALRSRWTICPLLGLSLVFAGGTSNLVDRVARGTVIDFLNIGVGPLRTGIFNVADMAIMLGVLLLFIRQGRDAEPDEHAA